MTSPPSILPRLMCDHRTCTLAPVGERGPPPPFTLQVNAVERRLTANFNEYLVLQTQPNDGARTARVIGNVHERLELHRLAVTAYEGLMKEIEAIRKTA